MYSPYGMWAQVPTEPRELAYHRLGFADPKHRWWKPLIEALIGGPIFVVLSILVAIPYMVYLFQSSGSANEMDFALQDLQNRAVEYPADFLMVFLSIVIMWPCLLIARICMGPKPWGLIHSVLGRIRWSWLALCVAISLVFYVIVPVTIELLAGGELAPEPHAHGNRLLLMLGLVLLVVPFQCYAEELVFRGYLMQTVGRWLKHPAWAIILPAPLFMLGHAYDFWGQASILVMGLAAGFMVWYTGGLEAGIAMHVVNNLYLMILGVLGMADPFAQGGTTWVDFVWAVGAEVLLVLVVMFAARKVGVSRTHTYRVEVR
ncbi:CPBP family intramembrane glutamic endopeptidase [Rothia aerolata]|uniref:CAAX amino protease n=1 Tax=Rothia aerolata TaxID=1812262 RepID=A0A917MSU1_9MICC|nr:type II CAAX endopeptidase family protein [Rothia aerolata]GGH62114.1 CAAX amino protease [Rothia aerolata]